MKKCMASENGICRNALGFGEPCDGYSNKCKLKPVYDRLQNIADGLAKSMRNALGIKGDKR